MLVAAITATDSRDRNYAHDFVSWAASILGCLQRDCFMYVLTRGRLHVQLTKLCWAPTRAAGPMGGSSEHSSCIIIASLSLGAGAAASGALQSASSPPTRLL